MTNDDVKKIWDVLVEENFKDFYHTFPELFLYEGSKEDFLHEYNKIRRYCKENYMKNSAKPVDRHKVSAAIMIAILKTEPIKMDATLYKNTSAQKWLFNEKLAISVGMSILKAFVDEANKEDKDILNKFMTGIAFPPTNHGNYLNNFATELYYTRKENTYNLLALANELFLLEVYTKNFS